MLTIKAKIIFSYTLVFGILLSAFAFVIYRASEEAAIAKRDAQLERYAAKIQEEFTEERNPPLESLRNITAVNATELEPVQFQIVDRLGVVVSSDSALTQPVSEHWRDVLRDRTHVETITMSGVRYRAYEGPIELDGEPKFSLALVMPLEGVRHDLEHLRMLFGFGIPSALLLTGLAALLITRAAFRPLTKMIETARQISATNLTNRVDIPKARDEMRLLAETFNAMIQRLDAAFQAERQFIADASHELRTPLTVIQSELEFAERNLDERPQTEQARESIQISLSEVARLARISEGLLTLARADADQLALHRTALRLDELLVECVQRLSGIAAKKEIEVQVFIQEAIEVQADPDKLKSVIVNLLENAINYCGEKSCIELLLSWNGERTRARIVVKDNGPGIPAEELPNIFKRFYRSAGARAESRGSGLGLAIVEKVVSLHHGTVCIESEEGKGTTARVEIPVKL